MIAASQKGFIFAFSVLALIPDVAASAQPLPAQESLLSRLHAADVMVEAVGFRLASTNAPLCPAAGWDPGFAIHTLEQYRSDDRIEAALSFGLNRWPTVMSVAPGSPAAQAGLTEGDALIAIDGKPLPETGQTSAAADFARTAMAQRAIETAFAHGMATLTVARDAQRIDVPIQAIPACRGGFRIVPEAAMSDPANGVQVRVSAALVALAQTPDELAAVLAHGLALSMLDHRDAQHVSRGWLPPFGRNARLIRETEIQADRLSLYLVARAGYSVPAALGFWVRLAKVERGVELDSTRSQWHDRLDALQREAHRIATGMPPDLAPPPELVAAIAKH